MRASLKHRACFRIFNLNYRIRTDSADVVRFFNRAYSLFKDVKIKTTLPGKNISMVVRLRRGTNTVMDTVLGTNARIFRTLIKDFTREFIFLHSSSVEIKGKYLLFMGDSLSGKSTMASMLRDNGACVLGDDITLIKYSSGRVVRFPIFSNIRKGRFTRLQKKHLKVLELYIRKFRIIRREYLTSMSEREFNAYYSYNKDLYRANGDRSKGKKIIAIFLTGKEKGIPMGLCKVGFPHSLDMFMDAVHMPEPGLKKTRLKRIINIFGDMDFYTLKTHSAREALQLVQSNFNSTE